MDTDGDEDNDGDGDGDLDAKNEGRDAQAPVCGVATTHCQGLSTLLICIGNWMLFIIQYFDVLESLFDIF